MEEKGVTFGEIFSAIGRRIYIVIAATLLLTAAVVVAVQFGYNAAKGSYRLTFTLSYPADAAGKYPDGTVFYYQDIVSREALSETKQSDSRFARIDTDKMYEKDAISVIREEEAGRYTLAANVSYFSDRSTATAFLKALCDRIAKSVPERARTLSYSLDESAFAGADFEGKISLLARQREEILAQYDEWIALYRGGYSVSGKTLANHRAEVDVLFGTALQEALLSELEASGYVPLELLETQRASLRAEKELNTRKIEELTRVLSGASSFLPGESTGSTIGSTTTSYPDLSETIASLIVRNVQIDSQLSALEDEANIRAFENRLSGEYTKLQGAAENAQAVGVALYEKETRLNFETSRATESGGMNLILAGVGGLVLSLLAVCLVVCLAEIPKERRKSGQAQETENE